MANLKVNQILTLSHLLSKGAKYNFITLSTTSVGKSIKKSQQAASKHLIELEQAGFLERIIHGRSLSVKITKKGYSELVKLSAALNSSLGNFPSFIELQGTLISGMGEGAYYMSLKGYTQQFKKKIGYVPFPGTLNVKLDKKKYLESAKQLEDFDGKIINGFSDNKRTYGWVKCFKAKLNNSKDCDLIVLERTHHDYSIVEVISKYNLRDTANLKSGSQVTIKIPLGY